jgi:hypothetical protein
MYLIEGLHNIYTYPIKLLICSSFSILLLIVYFIPILSFKIIFYLIQLLQFLKIHQVQYLYQTV